jgi:hypothetical protein
VIEPFQACGNKYRAYTTDAGGKAQKERYMAPPIFLGRFNGNFKSPMSVRNWVVENVPCTKGPVPQEWTHAIYAKLRQSYVDPAVIQLGLTLARADGYVFDDGTVPISILTTTPKPFPINTGPTMGVPSESPKQARKHVAEVLEWQFEKAKLNSNYGEMRRIAQQFADLLNSAEPIDEEIQWGAPLLRDAVRRNRDGSDPVPRGGDSGRGGPYRPGLYVPVPIVEGEGEAEGE